MMMEIYFDEENLMKKNVKNIIMILMNVIRL